MFCKLHKRCTIQTATGQARYQLLLVFEPRRSGFTQGGPPRSATRTRPDKHDQQIPSTAFRQDAKPNECLQFRGGFRRLRLSHYLPPSQKLILHNKIRSPDNRQESSTQLMSLLQICSLAVLYFCLVVGTHASSQEAYLDQLADKEVAEIYDRAQEGANPPINCQGNSQASRADALPRLRNPDVPQVAYKRRPAAPLETATRKKPTKLVFSDETPRGLMSSPQPTLRHFF